MKAGSLSIKGARFDGRGGENDLILSGHGSSSSKRGGIVYESRGGTGLADSFTVRSSATPNVATLMSQAQEESSYVSNALSDRGYGDTASVGSLSAAREQSSIVSSLGVGGLNGRPTGTGTTSLNTAIEASGNLGDNFRKPEIPGSNDRVHDGRDGGPDGDSGSMNKYWVSPQTHLMLKI